jgi:hypothetical protein
VSVSFLQPSGDNPQRATAPIQSRAEIADLYSRVALDYAEKGPSYFALAARGWFSWQ